MRFMLQVRADRDTEAGVLQTKELVAAMGRFNEEMIGAGITLAAGGLHPSSKGARVSFAGGKPSVIEPPSADPKELIAGFRIIDVASKEAAIDWARRTHFRDGTIEVRPLFEASDFPPEILSAGNAAREQACRDGQQRNSAPSP
jgi:hypothetical protein